MIKGWMCKKSIFQTYYYVKLYFKLIWNSWPDIWSVTQFLNYTFRIPDLHSIPWVKYLSTSLEVVSILFKQIRLLIMSLLNSLENTAAMRSTPSTLCSIFQSISLPAIPDMCRHQETQALTAFLEACQHLGQQEGWTYLWLQSVSETLEGCCHPGKTVSTRKPRGLRLPGTTSSTCKVQ